MGICRRGCYPTNSNACSRLDLLPLLPVGLPSKCICGQGSSCGNLLRNPSLRVIFVAQAVDLEAPRFKPAKRTKRERGVGGRVGLGGVGLGGGGGEEERHQRAWKRYHKRPAVGPLCLQTDSSHRAAAWMCLHNSPVLSGHVHCA